MEMTKYFDGSNQICHIKCGKPNNKRGENVGKKISMGKKSIQSFGFKLRCICVHIFGQNSTITDELISYLTSLKFAIELFLCVCCFLPDGVPKT